MAWCDVVELRTLRECRIALGKSQAAFAALLGVSAESYRTWDAGRRATPPLVMVRARVIATHRDDHALLPLPVLALLIGVHVKTLRAAARDGRLPVTFDTRTTFRRLRARATPAAAQQFRRRYFGRQVRRADRRQPLTWASVPEDYDLQIRVLRRERGVSQAQFAAMIGAAGKAVVYQWEARKRTPSPLFWQRIAALRVPAVSPSGHLSQDRTALAHPRPCERSPRLRPSALGSNTSKAKPCKAHPELVTLMPSTLITVGRDSPAFARECLESHRPPSQQPIAIAQSHRAHSQLVSIRPDSAT